MTEWPEHRAIALTIALIALVLLAAPATAHAGTTLVTVPSTPTTQALYQSWVDQSRMPTPDHGLEVRLRNCDDDAMACMVWGRGPHGEPTVRLYFPDLAYLAGPLYAPEQLNDVRMTFLHELGHTLDWRLRHRPRLLRRPFMRIMRYQGGWWSWRHEDVAPGETFADEYARCAAPPGLSTNYRGYGATITTRQHRRACALIRSVRYDGAGTLR